MEKEETSMPVNLTKEEIEGIQCLLEQEIKSNIDYLDDVEDKEEKEYWEDEIIFLKEVKSKFNACLKWK